MLGRGAACWGGASRWGVAWRGGVCGAVRDKKNVTAPRARCSFRLKMHGVKEKNVFVRKLRPQNG